MKNKHINTAIILLIAGVLGFTSCEKKYVDEYEPYSPSSVSAEAIGLVYNSPLVTDPVSEVIVSDTPSFTIEGYYKFAIDTVLATPDAVFNYNRFGISTETGVISYDNTGNTLGPGSYFVSVAVINIVGAVFFDSVFEMRVNDVSAAMKNAVVEE